MVSKARGPFANRHQVHTYAATHLVPCGLPRRLELQEPMRNRSNSMSNELTMHATTIVTVRKGGKVVIAGDGQVSQGQTIMKGNARKVRRIGASGNVIAGFAGATADA